MNHPIIHFKKLICCIALLAWSGWSLAAENNQATLDTQAPDPHGKGSFGRLLSLQKPVLSGADVKLLQQKLLALGYAELGEADGYFGQKSEMALKRFQRFNGLFPNGVFGKLTQEHLYAENAVDAKDVPNHGPLACVALPDFYLGAISPKAGWIDAAKSVLELPTSQQWTLLSTLESGQAILKKSWPASVIAADPTPNGPCEWINELQSNPSPPEFAIASTGDWNLVPRPVKQIEPAQFPGLATLSAYAKLHACSLSASNISQVIQTDVDGDGKLEYLVVASKGSNPGMSRRAGDFTVILEYRPAAAGAAASISVLAETWHDKDIDGFSGNGVDQEIRAVFDADGDGAMEVLCDYRAYEANGSVLFAKQKAAWKEVLSEGCGV